jgi:hypothetical protein
MVCSHPAISRRLVIAAKTVCYFQRPQCADDLQLIVEFMVDLDCFGQFRA